MKGLDLDDVCDAVFGEYTREGPVPVWLSPGRSQPWVNVFGTTEGEHEMYVTPEWYLRSKLGLKDESDRIEVQYVHDRRRHAFIQAH